VVKYRAVPVMCLRKNSLSQYANKDGLQHTVLLIWSADIRVRWGNAANLENQLGTTEMWVVPSGSGGDRLLIVDAVTRHGGLCWRGG